MCIGSVPGTENLEITPLPSATGSFGPEESGKVFPGLESTRLATGLPKCPVRSDGKSAGRKGIAGGTVGSSAVSLPFHKEVASQRCLQQSPQQSPGLKRLKKESIKSQKVVVSGSLSKAPADSFHVLGDIGPRLGVPQAKHFKSQSAKTVSRGCLLSCVLLELRRSRT